jgi:bacterioferritin-associated ferredoxin
VIDARGGEAPADSRRLAALIAATFRSGLAVAGCEEKPMIVCSCNVFSEVDVQAAVARAARRVSEIYTSLGCTPQCGRCAQTVKRLLADAMTVRRQPHSIARGSTRH